jgi:hypothetical protein
MAELPVQRSPEGEPQGLDIQRLMQMYDPKQLLLLSQALTGLLKANAALQPPPDPQQEAMQPGAMEQLAALELIRRRRQAAAAQQEGQGSPPGLPIPLG